MKSRFELDHIPAESAPTILIGPEGINLNWPKSEVHDARAQQFDANSENSQECSRFVVEEQTSCADLLTDNPLKYPTDQMNFAVEVDSDGTESVRAAPARRTSPEAAQLNDESSWRQEVTQRLSNYQARKRPRGPRYPSLQLKFEPEEAAWTIPSAKTDPSPACSLLIAPRPGHSPTPEIAPSTLVAHPPLDTTARVIAFPRSSTTPPRPVEELADPVFDRPRIMEAPEFAPPPPALGGILIEQSDPPANEKRPGFEIPLQSARMARRLAATVIDGFIVLVGLVSFAAIFWRITATVPPIRFAAGGLAFIAGILWSGYQYLLIVYCGTSPGLKLANLSLSNFDGTTVPRKIRRWRVLACFLSGIPLGLGYAWCFLDEDQLCWHDRITRTYIAPNA